jgi:hypothetical protein
LSRIFPGFTFVFLASGHVVQMLVFYGNPIGYVEFVGVDVALDGAVAAEEENAGKGPVDGAGPIGEEDKKADGGDVVLWWKISVCGGYKGMLSCLRPIPRCKSWISRLRISNCCFQERRTTFALKGVWSW